jgi:hypothetical protein
MVSPAGNDPSAVSAETGVLPNQRMKLAWRGGRLEGKESILMAAAAPRSLCAIR